MPRLHRSASLLALLFSALLLVAACSSDDDEGDASASGAGDDHEHEAAEIAVALSEWAIAPVPADGEHGEFLFEVTNEGQQPHELVVIQSDAAADDLPTGATGVDEEQVEVLGKVQNIAAGGTAELSLELDAGAYILVCNIPGHYQLGMVTDFTVE
jgi:uncharacterized cupredoxin-like copper-binding protein